VRPRDDGLLGAARCWAGVGVRLAGGCEHEAGDGDARPVLPGRPIDHGPGADPPGRGEAEGTNDRSRRSVELGAVHLVERSGRGLANGRLWRHGRDPRAGCWGRRGERLRARRRGGGGRRGRGCRAAIIAGDQQRRREQRAGDRSAQRRGLRDKACSSGFEGITVGVVSRSPMRPGGDPRSPRKASRRQREHHDRSNEAEPPKTDPKWLRDRPRFQARASSDRGRSRVCDSAFAVGRTGRLPERAMDSCPRPSQSAGRRPDPARIAGAPKPKRPIRAVGASVAMVPLWWNQRGFGSGGSRTGGTNVDSAPEGAALVEPTWIPLRHPWPASSRRAAERTRPRGHSNCTSVGN
jgi:hypothetical protein